MANIKKSSTSEKTIEHEILNYLNRLPGCFAWKVNSGGVFDGHTYRKANSPFIFKGVSDILGVFNGRFIAFEVKTDVGRPTKEQLAFIAKIQRCGGLGGVVRSVEDVQKVLREGELLFEELTDDASIVR